MITDHLSCKYRSLTRDVFELPYPEEHLGETARALRLPVAYSPELDALFRDVSSAVDTADIATLEQMIEEADYEWT